VESGGLELQDAARAPRLGGPKQRAVLGLLVQNANQLVSLERLTDELWASPPRRAEASVRAHIARLRLLLAQETDGRATIETWRGAYLLRVDPETQRALEDRLDLPAPSVVPMREPVRRRPRALWRFLAPAAVALLALGAAVLAANDPLAASTSVKRNSAVAINSLTNSVRGEVALPGRPGGIAIGAGSVWVGDRDHRTVLRLQNRRVVERISLNVEPIGVAAGEGGVWVLGKNGVVQQVDPARSAIVATIPVAGKWDRCCTDDIAFADGAVWVSRGGTLARIDPETHRVAGTGFHGVRTIGSSGRELWGVLGLDFERLRRLVPLGNAARLEDVQSTEKLGGLVPGQRSLWIGSADGKLRRIEAGTGLVLASLSLKRRITDVAVTPSGVVWVALQKR
jgi:DNA-binding winged helix-turn-helix (wHTH) protein